MCENKVDRKKEKIIYFEICRIIAIFCVLYRHAGGRGADAWMYTNSSWVHLLSLTGVVISCVGMPLLWMTSGALLLPRKEPWQKVYKKRIPRIVVALLLFSAVRYIYVCLSGNQAGSVLDFCRQFYAQEIFVPYWFLYEYIGILFVLPFLRKMVQNLTEQEECVLFVFILGWSILNDISKAYLGTGFVLDFPFSGSLSYFILGYLMENCQVLRKSNRKVLWFGIVQVVLLTSGIYIWVSGQRGMEALVYAAEGSLSMLLTISVYDSIRYLSEKSNWNNEALRKFILWCGSNVFGLYLIEDYLRNATAVIWEKLAPYISTLPACFIWLFIVFLIGNVLVAAARKLPFFRKIL